MEQLSLITLIVFSGSLITYLGILLYNKSHEPEHKESVLYEIRKDFKEENWISIYEQMPPMRNSRGEQITYQVRFRNGQYGVYQIKNHDTWIDYLKSIGVTHWQKQ
jgi:cell division protein YceG involved in septum cleavage